MILLWAYLAFPLLALMLVAISAILTFFRGHAHINTCRREPRLMHEPYCSTITAALCLCYVLLPAWYKAFYQASHNRSPIVRPIFCTYLHNEDDFSLNCQKVGLARLACLATYRSTLH